MKCFVINLPQSTERRDSISRKLSKLEIDFEIFPATYGKELSFEQESLCSHEEAQLTLGRNLWGQEVKLKIDHPLSAGEIGCALSHLSLYQHIVDEGLEYACILEDDVQIKPNFKLALDAIDAKVISEPWDIVNFSNHEGIKNCPFAKRYDFAGSGELSGGYFQRVGLGRDILDVTFNARRMIALTWMYVISRSACQRLLSLGYPVRLPSDYLTGIVAFNKLKVFRAFPINNYGYANQEQSDIGNRPYHKIRRV